MEIWSPYSEICCDIRIDVSAKLITADPTVKKLENNISSWWRSSQGLLTCTGRMRSGYAITRNITRYFVYSCGHSSCS